MKGAILKEIVVKETASRPDVYIAATGAANLASIGAGLERAGARPIVTDDPARIASARLAVLPGVGAFGPAARRLEETGLADAFRARMNSDLPVMGICLGMQLFFEESAEAPGIKGLGLLPGRIARFSGDLPLPQLGWNRVRAAKHAETYGSDAESEDSVKTGTCNASGFLVRDGWAYFANSYRLASIPAGYRAALAEYGEPFVAALENETGSVLLCQFHPELSGLWGSALIARWIEGKERQA